MPEDNPAGVDDGAQTPPDAAVTPADAGDLSTLISLSSHFYRGEMDRVTTWRTRMDQTTNWAVVVMAAILTWAFTSTDNPHYVLLVAMLAVSVFLFVEAGRFQEYDALRERVRVLQANLFAEGYDPRGPAVDEWREWLGRDLRDPTIRLSLVSALGHRLQHVYFPLLSVLLVAWVLRVSVFEPGTSWWETAAIANVPGVAVVALVGLGYLVAAGLTVRAVRRSVRREFEFDTGSESPDQS